MRWLFPSGKKRGAMAPFVGVGIGVATFMAAPFVLDMPLYFNYQQQLQNSVDAATLAAAYEYPNGESSARAAALELLAQNPVADTPVDPNGVNINFINGTNIRVNATTNVPMFSRKFLCSFMVQQDDPNQENENESVQTSDCDTAPISAKAEAVPAARDTIIVFDHSGSMNETYYGKKPINEAKTAARKYVDYVGAMQAQSVDRIGVVTFSFYGKNNIGLTSKTGGQGFTGVKTAITNIGLSNDNVGWETNYTNGLKQGIDMMLAQARPNADKVLIFLTDGGQNTPGPTGGSWNISPIGNKITRCTNMVYNQSNFKPSVCTSQQVWRSGRWQTQWTCPTLPSAAIPDWLIPQTAVNCANEYVNAMNASASEQISRAKTNRIKIHSISIIPADELDEGSIGIIRRLMKQPNWIPPALAMMTAETEGNAYAALGYNEATMTAAYQEIARAYRPILTNGVASTQ